MKLNNIVIFSIFTLATFIANAKQCTEDQVKVKGQCEDASTCKQDLKYFKALKRNNTGNGADQLPNLPNFSLGLDNKNLKVSLTFLNSTGLNTNLEQGSCLIVSLSRFKVAFTQQQDDSTTINSVLNTDNSRTWSFTIDNSNFDSYLAKDNQTDYIIYSGFYAVNLNYTKNKNVQLASFAFRFNVNVTSNFSSITNFDVAPRPRGEPVCADTEETQCVQQAASTIVCCGTDSTCKTTVTNTTLVVGETYYFLQNVTENGFNNGKWRPSQANITVQADGVTKMVKPKIFSQSASGTIYEVKFKFIANNVTIASDATLAQVATRRLLQTTTDTNASAVASTSSSCITTSASACPTSDEVKTYNSANCAGTSCDDDASSNAFIIIGITIMSLLI